MSPQTIADLKIKIFADGADIPGMVQMYQHSLIQGFTTNPTLMRKAGVTNYQEFAQEILKTIHDRPISFEVFSDDFDEMYEQALLMSSWGKNVYVKIPVMNTQAEPAYQLIKSLAEKKVKLNITALMTLDQVFDAAQALEKAPASYISVFAGRIADTGRNPMPIMAQALEIMQPYTHLELIWASPRELFNIFQANEVGCHIITVPNDILKKLSAVGKDLTEFSLETVRMFRDDAINAGFELTTV